MPVPGATVVLPRGTQKFSNVTDRQGLFEFPDVADGIWKIHSEMQGFMAVDADATIGGLESTEYWSLSSNQRALAMEHRNDDSECQIVAAK